LLKIISVALLTLSLSISCKSADNGSPRPEGSSFPDIQFIPKDTDSARDAAAPATAPLVEMSAAPLILVDPALSAKECKAEDTPICPVEELEAPSRAVAVKYQGQLLPDHEQVSAWGSSPCQARLALFKAACSNHLNFALINEITIHPDANEADCPAAMSECDDSKSPSKCFAESYDEQELAWSSRPQAWGSNECDARNKLAKKACNLGINPKELKAIRCEAESSALICPPIWKNCAPQENELSECKLSKVGEINLKKPLTAIGSSRCEATYRLQELACRYQKGELKDLAGIDCQPLSKEKSYSTAPNSAESATRARVPGEIKIRTKL
jgi:hypothetical protein